MNRFLREPISVRNAASVIVTATFIVVVARRDRDQGDRPSRVLEHLGGHVVVPADGHDSRVRRRDAQGHRRQDRRRGRDARGDRVPRDHHGGDHLDVRDARAARAEVRRAGRGDASRKHQSTRSSNRSPRGSSESSRCCWSSRDGDSHRRRPQIRIAPGVVAGFAGLGDVRIYAEKDDSKMRGHPRYWSPWTEWRKLFELTAKRPTCRAGS